MKKGWLILFIAAVVAFAGATGVTAAVIPLDGIANAGWYADDLTKAHLYIANTDNPGTYYYQWAYSAATPAPLWSSRENLATDLSDGVLVNGKPVGNWRVESAGDVFNNPAQVIYKTLSIAPGTYTLRLTNDSRAYQLNEFLWPNESNGAPVWNAYVQMLARYDDTSTGSFNFGDWSDFKGSESDVLTYYRNNVDGMSITIPKSGTMYFYINDYNSVDNGASVTLEFSASPVPLPGSLVLLGSGLVAGLLLGRRRC